MDTIQDRHRLTAVLLTDMAGYTELMERDEQLARRLVRRQREVLHACVEAHEGQVLREFGDGFLVTFDSATAAVRCALEVQEKLKGAQDPALRIGVHIGDVVIEEGSLQGVAVNIAQRLEAMAEPRSVYISGDVWSQIRNQPGFTATAMGARTLKGVRERVEVYRAEPDSVGDGGTRRHTRRRPTRWRRAAMVVAGMLVVLGVMRISQPYLFRSELEAVAEAKAPAGKKSVAVLYFDNLSVTEEGAVWAAGMTEAVITALAKLGRLDVKSRTQMLPYKDNPIHFSEIRKQLGVDALLEGSLQKAGHQVRIHAQLIDTHTGNHLWTGQYDRPATDIFAVQDEVSQQIARALGVELTDIQPDILAAQPTQDVRAFVLASRGIYYYDRAMYEPALDAFNRALEIDPDYASAHYYKGRTYHALQNDRQAIEAYQQALPGSQHFSRTLWEWRNPYPERVSWLYAPDERLAFGLIETQDRTQLVALDCVRREEIWRQTIPDMYMHPVGVRGHVVYVTSTRWLRSQPGEPALYAYDIRTGALLARREFPRDNPDQRLYRLRPTQPPTFWAEDGAPPEDRDIPWLVYRSRFSEDESDVYRLDPQDGTIRWSFTYDNAILDRPAVLSRTGGDPLLVLGSRRHYVLLNLTDGAKLRDIRLDAHEKLFVNRDVLIRVTEDSTAVTGVGVPDGAPLWSYTTDAPIRHIVNLPGNGLLILQLDGGELLALDAGRRWFEFGRAQWRADPGDAAYKLWYQTDDPLFPNSPPMRINTLYACSGTGVVTTVDVRSGALLGRTLLNREGIKLRVLEDSVIGIASDTLFRLDPRRGTVHWTARMPTPPEFFHAFYPIDNKLLIGTPNRVSAYDLQYGDLLWQYAYTSENSLSPYVWQPAQEARLWVGEKAGLVELNLQENPEVRLIQEKEVLFHLSRSEMALKRYEEAAEHLTEVVGTIDPGYAPAYRTLADLYESTGRRNDAVRALVDYHTLFQPTGSEASAAVERLKALGGLAWRTEVSSSDTRLTIDGARLFTGGHRILGGRIDLSALDRETGSTIWKKPFFNTLLIGDREGLSVRGRCREEEPLFVITQDAAVPPNWILVSIDKATGETRWQTTLFSTKEGWLLFKKLHRRRLYLYGGMYNRKAAFIQAFSVDSGALLWKRFIPLEENLNTWAFSGNRLAVALGRSNVIQVLDARTGGLLWTHRSDAKLTGRMTMLERDGVPNGRLVFTTRDNRYHGLDLNRRVVLWSFEAPLTEPGYTAGFGNIHTVGDTLFDSSGRSHRLFAFTHDPRAPGNVRILWNTRLDKEPIKQLRESLTDTRRAVYVITRDGMLLQIDKATGAVEGERPLLWEGRPHVQDGVAYFGAPGYLYALKLE